jgi:hypothetical protein
MEALPLSTVSSGTPSRFSKREGRGKRRSGLGCGCGVRERGAMEEEAFLSYTAAGHPLGPPTAPPLLLPHRLPTPAPPPRHHLQEGVERWCRPGPREGRAGQRSGGRGLRAAHSELGRGRRWWMPAGAAPPVRLLVKSTVQRGTSPQHLRVRFDAAVDRPQRRPPWRYRPVGEGAVAPRRGRPGRPRGGDFRTGGARARRRRGTLYGWGSCRRPAQRRAWMVAWAAAVAGGDGCARGTWTCRRRRAL